MNRDDTLRIARETGLHVPCWGEGEDPEKDPPRWVMVSPLLPLLEHFAAKAIERFLESSGQYLTNNASREDAIRQAVEEEREACAKLAETRVKKQYKHINGGKPFEDFMCWADIAAAIRARGQK